MKEIINMFKTILLTIVLATSVFAQGTTNLGIFEGASDVGEVAKKGIVAFDAAKGEYRMTGGGVNIWAKSDGFFFLWRKLSGDITLTANVRFESPGGVAHKRVALMIRQNLAPGSPHVNATVHGNGLVTLQYRKVADGISASVQTQVKSSTRIRLERRDNHFTFYAAQEGQPLIKAAEYDLDLTGPVYAGLVVCPHDAQAEMTAVFSDVTLENPAPAEPLKEEKK